MMSSRTATPALTELYEREKQSARSDLKPTVLCKTGAMPLFKPR